MDLAKLIRDIPDFPEKGILFRDITTLLKDPDGLKAAVAELDKAAEDVDFEFVVAPESRGFIFGVPVACDLGKGFVPIRKKGKLPADTYSTKYALEYGEAEIEMHKDALKPGQKVVIIDDLLATGGTAKAMKELVEKAGAEVVKFIFLIELTGLNGKDEFEGTPYTAVIKY